MEVKAKARAKTKWEAIDVQWDLMANCGHYRFRLRDMATNMATVEIILVDAIPSERTTFFINYD